MNQKDLRRLRRILMPGEKAILATSHGGGPTLEGVVTMSGLAGWFIRTKDEICVTGARADDLLVVGRNLYQGMGLT